jgi:hypothetical protein
VAHQSIHAEHALHLSQGEAKAFEYLHVGPYSHVTPLTPS